MRGNGNWNYTDVDDTTLIIILAAVLGGIAIILLSVWIYRRRFLKRDEANLRIELNTRGNREDDTIDTVSPINPQSNLRKNEAFKNAKIRNSWNSVEEQDEFSSESANPVFNQADNELDVLVKNSLGSYIHSQDIISEIGNSVRASMEEQVKEPEKFVEKKNFIASRDSVKQRVQRFSIDTAVSSTFANTNAFKEEKPINNELLYPGMRRKRGYVHKRSFDIEQRDYKPEEFTASDVLVDARADPVASQEFLSVVRFNTLDATNGTSSVDRTSCNGVYKVLQRLPINPLGRTGVTGRGQLLVWGPNHYAIPVITRWKINNGVPVERNGKKVLEFVMSTASNGALSLPKGFELVVDGIPSFLLSTFNISALSHLGPSEATAGFREVYKLFNNQQELEFFLADNELDTDQAWIENYAHLIHDEESKVFKSIKLGAKNPALNISWATLDETVSSFPEKDLEILKKAADHCQSFFYNKSDHVASVAPIVSNPPPVLAGGFSGLGNKTDAQKKRAADAAAANKATAEAAMAASKAAAIAAESTSGNHISTLNEQPKDMKLKQEELALKIEADLIAQEEERLSKKKRTDEQIVSHVASAEEILAKEKNRIETQQRLAERAREREALAIAAEAEEARSKANALAEKDLANKLATEEMATISSPRSEADLEVENESGSTNKAGSVKPKYVPLEKLLKTKKESKEVPVIPIRSSSFGKSSTNEKEISARKIAQQATDKKESRAAKKVAEEKEAADKKSLAAEKEKEISNRKILQAAESLANKEKELSAKKALQAAEKEKGADKSKAQEVHVSKKKSVSEVLEKGQKSKQDAAVDDVLADKEWKISDELHKLATNEMKKSLRRASKRTKSVKKKKGSIEIFEETTTKRLKECFVGVYEAEFLGAVPLKFPADKKIANECAKVCHTSNLPKRKVQLVISSDGCEMEESGPVTTGADGKESWLSALTTDRILKSIPLSIVRLFTEVACNSSYFALCTEEVQKGKDYCGFCFIFILTSSPSAVVRAFDRACALSLQLKTDPFWAYHDSEFTPEGAFPELAEKQVDRATLDAVVVIGQGQYGKVLLCKSKTLSKVQYAVKLMRGDTNVASSADFAEEAKSLAQFDHPSLLTLVGVCFEKKPWLLITDYMCYKDLHLVLRGLATQENYLYLNEIIPLGIQVAEGLEYLGSLRFIHRDIAARNIVLRSNNQVKIADFGLARKLPDGLEFWKLDKLGRLPVKYMAVETLTLKHFSLSSDVWAFGVFLWELISYCENPYEKEKILLTSQRAELVKGTRLSLPDFFCPASMSDPDTSLYFIKSELAHDAVFRIGQKCWIADPNARPKIGQVLELLKSCLEDINTVLPAARDVGEVNNTFKPEVKAWKTTTPFE